MFIQVAGIVFAPGFRVVPFTLALMVQLRAS